ncbi:hypothetical protein MCUN1_003161 [Malassezia cuniculi]|uniref:PUM-HD domain-containing protein n=1 Tax=Malassezia cuniculi TaxID=948313 RepID=A0AAF0J7I3_9BASI|nr:hypothetical protein MCUN1_003161 [Malassezia cuniculi]
MQDAGGAGPCNARRSASPIRTYSADTERFNSLQHVALGAHSAHSSVFADNSQPLVPGPSFLAQARRSQQLDPGVRTATAGAAAAAAAAGTATAGAPPGRPRPQMPKRTMTDGLNMMHFDPMIWTEPLSVTPKIHTPHRAATLDAAGGPSLYDAPLYSDPLTTSVPSLSSPISSPFARQGPWTPPTRHGGVWREMSWPRPGIAQSLVDTPADAAAVALKQNAEATVAAAIGDDGDDVAFTSSPTALAPTADNSYVPPLEQHSPSPPNEIARRMHGMSIKSPPPVHDVHTPSHRSDREPFVWPRPRHTLATPVRTTDGPLSMYAPFGNVTDVFSAPHAAPPMPPGMPGVAGRQPDMYSPPVEPQWSAPAPGPSPAAVSPSPATASAQPASAPIPQAFRRDSRSREKGHRGQLREEPSTAASTQSRLEIQDARGRLVELSTDQHGSRLIQEKLDHCTPEERDIVFAELYPEAPRLMSDVFGNYVIQKLIEHGTPAQVHALCEKLHGHVLSLSLGTYGCRVVQKAFEHMEQQQKIALGQELKPYVLHCVRDQNANHVIQKILEQLPADELEFISSAFQGHVSTLASHCYSCRVLQRIFAYCHEDQYRPLLTEMHRDSLRLMQDQYGNYVIQWVLQHGQRSDRAELIRKTKSRLLHLARHKFASNVMEQVIEMSSPADRRELLDEMLAPLDPADSTAVPPIPCKNAPVSPAMLMMQDQYANYVLQRFLQVATGNDRARLVEAIRPVLAELRNHATPGSGTGAFGYGVRLPGGGHIGAKPLQAIERLIEHPPERATSNRTAPRSRAAAH